MKQKTVSLFIFLLLAVLFSLNVSAQVQGFNYPVSPSTTSADSHSVGSPVGAFSISPLGAVIYSIPIEVPQGLPGATPEIGIVYHSQSGNGVAGYGCNLSGLSVISRGVRDIWHDGTAEGIDYTVNDAFYLDGQRLVSIENNVGSDTIVYCVESDPYLRVVLHGATGNSNLWFSATSKNGMRYEYGTSVTSIRSDSNNGYQYADAWYICKATCPTGNYIQYTYVKDNLQIYLNNIQYGQNENTPNSLNNRIDFTYESRNDVSFFKVHGQSGSMVMRLKEITSKTGNDIFRKYQLTYDNSSDGATTKFSRLTSVAESNGNNDTYKPITLEWQYLPEYVPQSQTLPFDIEKTENHYIATVQSDESQIFTSDLNGDGIADIIHKTRVNYIQNGSSYNRSVIYTYKSSIGQNGITYNTLPNYSYIPADIPQWGYWTDGPLICDFNGDGLNDIFIPYIATGLNHFALFYYIDGQVNSYGENNPPYFPYVLQNYNNAPLYTCSDLDKDGRADIIILETGMNSANLYEMCLLKGSSSFEQADTVKMALSINGQPRKIFAGDYNNDGLADLLIVHASGYQIFWNQGGTLTSSTFNSSLSVLNTYFGTSYRLYEGDYNGDGTIDFLATIEDTPLWFILLGNGDGTFIENIACSLSGAYKSSYNSDDDGKNFTCLVYDMDGDGKSDVFISKARYVGNSFDRVYSYWLNSTGSTLMQKNVMTSYATDNASLNYYSAGDFNGDGLAELVNYGYNCYSGGNRDTNLRAYNSQYFSSNSGKITNFTDGYGKEEEVSYGSLTSPSLYTKGTGAAYPVIDCTLPIHAVSGVEYNHGTGYARTESYSYGKMKCHLTGKGLLGLGKIARTDWTLSTYNCSETTLNANYLPYSVTESTVVDNQTATAITTYGSYQPYTGKKSWFVYPSTVNETDLDGNSFTKTYTYDFTKDGVPTETVSNHADGYAKTQYQNYTKYGGCYQPADVISETKYTGQAAFTERTHFSYSSQGLTTNVTTRYNTTIPVLTSYTYDAFGNVLSDTTSASGVENIGKTFLYDSSHRFVIQQTERDKVFNFTYDTWGNNLTMIDNTRSSVPDTTTYTYDGWGNLLTELQSTGQLTTHTKGWDSDGGSFIVTRGNGQPWTKTWYDRMGNKKRIETISWLDVPITENFNYNARGQMTLHSRVEGTGDDGLYRAKVCTYDNRGRLASENVSGYPWAYYSYGQNTVTSIYAGRRTVKQNDLWGNITAVTDTAGTTNYVYESNGRIKSASFTGDTINIGYDAYGRQISMTDPDAGQKTYTYDAYDRILTETDAANKVRSYTYDNNGRLIGNNIDGINTTYTYGQTSTDKGLLLSTQISNRTISYSYDTLGRLTGESRSFGSHGTWTTTLTYNSIGQIASKQYSDGPTVTYTYDAYGFKDEVRANGTLISKPLIHRGWEVVDKRGNYMLDDVYYDEGGRITDISLYDANTLQGYDQSYFYTATGNVSDRLYMFPDGELFEYDALDRLTSVWDTGSPQQITYSPNGNITFQTKTGSYYYDNTAKPHAVKGIDNTDGLMSLGSLTTYSTAFGKVLRMFHGNYRMGFTYGPDEQRWQTKLMTGSSVLRTIYYMGDCEQIEENGNTRRLYYLDDDAIYVKQTNKPDSIWFMYRDKLGSILAVTDYSGNELFKAAYDAWGRQTIVRNDIGFHRGYTGHEMLPEFGLINMNGRLYDPVVCRFLSPDPYVQEPFNSQNFNRYSYCLNNPLKYTDPTGELLGVDDIIIIGVGVLVGTYLGGVVTNNGELNPRQWNYSSFDTYLGMGVGGILGGFTGYGIAVPGSINFVFSASSPWVNVGVSASAATAGLGAGTNWKWNLHWTTAGGGGGSTAYSPSMLDEKIGQIYDDAVESMRNYYEVGRNGYNYVSQYFQLDYVHSALDATGVFIDVADAANAVLYGIEGDYVNAGLSAAAMLPVLGNVATAGKYANKGFKTFNKFKKEFGTAGEGMNWHHIVEQTPSNIQRFGPEMIHNTNNLIRIPGGKGSIHARISGHYSSKSPVLDGLTVRQWLSTKSFEEQYEYGLNMLNRYGWK